MSYKTRWFDRKECAMIAREVSTGAMKVVGMEIEDIGGNGVRMNGGYGANIERRLGGFGFEQTVIRRALGVDEHGNWVED